MNHETKNRILARWNANPLVEASGIAGAFGCDEADVVAVIREHCNPTSIAWRECDKRRILASSATRTTQPEFLAERRSAAYSGRTPKWSGRGTHWEAAQRAARRRDSNTCRICGMTGELQGRNMDVHHLRPYYSFPARKQANRLSNLVCLCRKCHSGAERGNLVITPRLTG